MLDTKLGTAETAAVNNALDIVETELKPALTLAAARLADVAQAHPNDTAVTYGHLADIYNLLTQIDRNVARRQAKRADIV
jgi:predicted lipid carrier protein YhbT